MMLNSKLPHLLVAAVLLAGALFFAFAGPLAGGLTITLEQIEEDVRAGEAISGLASGGAGGLIAVEMFIDGVLVETDEEMDGDSNPFDFLVPADAEGKILTIRATGSNGETVTKTYVVHPGRG